MKLLAFRENMWMWNHLQIHLLITLLHIFFYICGLNKQALMVDDAILTITLKDQGLSKLSILDNHCGLLVNLFWPVTKGDRFRPEEKEINQYFFLLTSHHPPWTFAFCQSCPTPRLAWHTDSFSTKDIVVQRHKETISLSSKSNEHPHDGGLSRSQNSESNNDPIFAPVFSPEKCHTSVCRCYWASTKKRDLKPLQWKLNFLIISQILSAVMTCYSPHIPAHPVYQSFFRRCQQLILRTSEHYRTSACQGSLNKSS